jgi:hypothetical protein
MLTINTEQARVEIEGSVYFIRPEDYLDIMLSYRRARKVLASKGYAFVAGLELDDDERTLLAQTAALFIIVARLTDWQGVSLVSGEEAECTDENKLLLFGKYPGLIDRIIAEITKKEETEEKNSETLQDGQLDPTL